MVWLVPLEGLALVKGKPLKDIKESCQVELALTRELESDYYLGQQYVPLISLLKL